MVCYLQVIVLGAQPKNRCMNDIDTVHPITFNEASNYLKCLFFNFNMTIPTQMSTKKLTRYMKQLTIRKTQRRGRLNLFEGRGCCLPKCFYKIFSRMIIPNLTFFPTFI